jgi:hypothetical protein
MKKILYYIRFISHFVARVLGSTLNNACDKIVSYKTCTINYYFCFQIRRGYILAFALMVLGNLSWCLLRIMGQR